MEYFAEIYKKLVNKKAKLKKKLFIEWSTEEKLASIGAFS